jgi:hypothetical protein
MFKEKTEEASGKTILLEIKKEMAKPRKAKSARDWEAKLAAAQMRRSKRGKTKL